MIWHLYLRDGSGVTECGMSAAEVEAQRIAEGGLHDCEDCQEIAGDAVG